MPVVDRESYFIISVPRLTTNVETLSPLIPKIKYLIGGIMGFQCMIYFLL